MNATAQNQYGISRPAIRLVTVADKQPKINPKLDLLYSEYEHDGLLIDLYGEYDKWDDTYDVQEIALAGSDICLDALMQQSLVEDFNGFLERTMPSQAELRAQAKCEAQIAAREDRELANY